MKTLVAALVALSVLSGYAASAVADKVPNRFGSSSTVMVAAVIPPKLA